MKDDIKIVSSKRQGDVGDVTSPRAPSGFRSESRPNKDEVLESISALPSAKSINLDGVQDMFASAVPDTSEKVLDSLPSTYKESLLEPEIIVEEKEEYVYSVPNGYEHLVPRLVEKKVDGDHVEELETRLVKLKDRSWDGIDKLMRGICKKHGISPKKLHDDFKAKHNQIPDEWVEKQAPAPKPKSEVEKLAEQIKVKKPKQELTEEVKGDLRDQKIAQLQQQIIDLRKITLETAQGTIVHGLGHQSTGSGEVNLARMDDVDVRNISDGSTLIWDAELGKFIPSGTSGVQLPGGNQDLTDRIEGIEDALLALQKFVMEHTEGDGLHPEQPEAHSHFGLINVLTYEATTNTLGARPVDFEDDTTAFIIAEESVDLDHFDRLLGDQNVLLIEVEGATPFEVTGHDHVPDFVAYERYTPTGLARDINFSDESTILLRLQQSDGVIDFPFEDELIVELETNTLTSTSEVAQIFGVEISTDTSSAVEFNWNDDVHLISPEGIVNPQDMSSAGDGTYLGLEDNVDGHDSVTIQSNQEVSQEFATAGKFFDEQPGGDINRFRVTTDSGRGVYKLDDIAQPAIQVPRGDILEFDLTAIQDRDEFTIFANGSELTNELERFPTLVSFDTAKLDTSTNKAYYRHRTKRGKGWLIVITDN